jgi:hypothetical protein
MFGFIKNLFGGIAAFFSGLFGGKKSQDEASAPKAKKSKGYFLELDDTGSVKAAAEAKKPEAAKAQAPQTEPAKAAVATLERPKAEPQANGAKPVAAKEVPSGKETVQVQAQPNPPAAATNGKVEPQDAGTFAPNYLLPKATNSRRRPGPSMDMFRDMARQVKTK